MYITIIHHISMEFGNMQLPNSCIIIVLLAVISSSHQTCELIDAVSQVSVPNAMWQYYWSYFTVAKSYVQCQNVVVSSDFHMNLDPEFDFSKIYWLEITNTMSSTISPGAFRTLDSLKDLRITDAKLQIIAPGVFDSLSNLDNLTISNNRLSNLSKNCFTNLSKLTRLDLRNNRIVDIEDGTFNGLDNLVKLFLQNNLITVLSPTLFQHLNRVEILDLSFNKLETIDDSEFSNMSSIVTLYLNNNSIQKIGRDAFAKNDELLNIYLNNNKLTVVEVFLPITNATLLVFNVSSNLIQSLRFLRPTCIGIFDLSSNGMLAIGRNFFNNVTSMSLNLDLNYIGSDTISKDTFADLATVGSISLANNQIEHLDPHLFAKNTELWFLSLAKNHLSQVDITKLPTSLNCLILSGNYLSELRNLSHLTYLRELNLGYNRFREISFQFLVGLKNLQTLDLQNNGITTMKLGCFRELRVLRQLNLASNNISSLEMGIFVGLNALQILDMSHNKLTMLDDNVFHNLRNLYSLSISYNKISYLNVKISLLHFAQLRSLDVKGNNWPCSFLSTIFREHGHISIQNGDEYNVTNVDGIACFNDDRMTNNKTNNAEFESKYFSRLTSNFTTGNTLLVLILIVLLIQLCLKYIPVCVRMQRIFVLRNKDEQEVQLI